MTAAVATVVDYGAGNIRSLLGAMAELRQEAVVTGDSREVRSARLLVLPGVGSFGSAMSRLRSSGLDEAVRGAAHAGAVLVGICLGMQLLGEFSEEDDGCEGLGLVPGKLEHFRSATDESLRIPHVGFNSVAWSEGSVQYTGLDNQSDFYFVHSFRFADIGDFAGHDIGITDYGGPFVSSFAINKQIFGMQFHPELSQGNGLRVLRNILEAQCA